VPVLAGAPDASPAEQRPVFQEVSSERGKKRALVSATHHLPSSAKNGFAFQLGDIGVGVPGAGYGMGLGQRSSGVKARDNLFKRTRHILSEEILNCAELWRKLPLVKNDEDR